jgi:hypothetical protein
MALQPSDPYQISNVYVNWKETTDRFVDADLADIYYHQLEQMEMYEQVKNVILKSQYCGKEDVLLNLMAEIDMRYVKSRQDYPAIKCNLDHYKQLLTDSKAKNNQGLLKNIA